MALTKQSLNINFAQGVETKVDPFQVQAGKFLSLTNSIFDKAGRLTKRNGYGALTALPTSSSTFLTTFNGGLTAIGTSLYAYSTSNKSWVNKGSIQPVSLSTLSLYRSGTNQSQADAIIASNGFICTVFTDNLPSGISYKYVVADSVTGQNISEPTLIPSGSGTISGAPRVFTLGAYFIILFTNTISGVNHLQYVAVSTSSPNTVIGPNDIASAYSPKTGLSFDAYSANSQLYIAYNSLSGGQNIQITSLSTNLIVQAPKIYNSEEAEYLTMCVDNATPSAPIVWVAYYNNSAQVKAFAVDKDLNAVLAPTVIASVSNVNNITAVANAGTLEAFYEVDNAYGYDSSVRTDFVNKVYCTQTGTVSGNQTLVRSVGLASKAFLIDNKIYFLGIYSSDYQPSYFLFNDSGKIVAKLAYSNAGGYYMTGLPNVSVIGSVASIPYLIKDLITSTNKAQGASNPQPVYTQLGVNLAQFDMDSMSKVLSAEIGSNLNITGGCIGAYDGFNITEQGFFVWPDSVETVPAAGGGSIAANTYYYQVTYEWTDNQGNVFKSAPSIPVQTVLGATGHISINVPTLRLTSKTATPVKIVIYRWSAAQQVYYAIQSPSAAPILNDPTVDYVTVIDAAADASIAGNPILYTTGGVLENVSPPSSSIMTLFNNRLWLVDAEDTNLLWYSKQVIETTPVEMSDLLTMYVAPTTGSLGSTGPVTALSPMDDKLIIFKKDALGYINGIGPDNTGANSQYSDFILINSVIGCSNEQSIVFTPAGLMFQSDKGIWLLGRDLSTSYIGAPVESYTTGATVQSAVNVPTTNQVRFTLDSGITLMYDYYYQQWSTFTNVPAVSSTIFESLHTYINSLGQVFQETPGQYLDNSRPVLMSFTSSWINLAGLQGFERFYQAYLLGTYITPFKLNVQFAFNYNSGVQQSTTVTPKSPSSAWGGDSVWGSSDVWGGPSNVFEARIFPQIQKCESFQVIIEEIYDPSYGIAAGAGLTLSGLNLVVGMKKGYRTSSAARSFG